MEKRDYYQVLGVDRSADLPTLKSAYRKLAFELHPDRNPGDAQAEDRFKEAAEAWAVLSNPERRQIYDQYGHAAANQGGGQGFEGFGGMGMDDIFSHLGEMFTGNDFFGFGGGQKRRRREPKGADSQIKIELSFFEAIKGCTKEVSIDRQLRCELCQGTGAKGNETEPCGTCKGRGQVVQSMGFMRIASSCPTCHGGGQVIKNPCSECRGGGVVRKTEKLELEIPAGVDEQSDMRVTGHGHQGPAGVPGNLYVGFVVGKDERFERRGDDLFTEVPISFAQASLGTEVAVPTIEGDEPIAVPAGTQPGTVVILKGRGVQHVEARGRGNLHVRLAVRVPRRVSAEQRKLIEQLAALDGQAAPLDPEPEPDEKEERGFFGRRKKRK